VVRGIILEAHENGSEHVVLEILESVEHSQQRKKTILSKLDRLLLKINFNKKGNKKKNDTNLGNQVRLDRSPDLGAVCDKNVVRSCAQDEWSHRFLGGENSVLVRLYYNKTEYCFSCTSGRVQSS